MRTRNRPIARRTAGKAGAQSKGSEPSGNEQPKSRQRKPAISPRVASESLGRMQPQEHRRRTAAAKSAANRQELRALALRAIRNRPAPTRRKAELAEAKTNQKAIADELQKMLDGLSEFETYRGVVKDAQELLKQQEQTMKQTAETADKPEMIGKPLEALSPEQKAELGNLSSRQSQVGKGLAEPAGADGRDGAPDG